MADKPTVESVLLLVLLQHLVTIILDASDNLADELSRLRLKEPAQSNNAFRDSAKVIEERGGSVRLADVVDGIRSIVKLSHKLRWLGLGLSRLCRDVKVGALGFESLKNSLGLSKKSETDT
jgi:hypothetical protein